MAALYDEFTGRTQATTGEKSNEGEHVQCGVLSSGAELRRLLSSELRSRAVALWAGFVGPHCCARDDNIRYAFNQASNLTFGNTNAQSGGRHLQRFSSLIRNQCLASECDSVTCRPCHRASVQAAQYVPIKDLRATYFEWPSLQASVHTSHSASGSTASMFLSSF